MSMHREQFFGGYAETMIRRVMKLIAFSLEGYRRFVSKTSVKLHGDMIAFVGPNEAGKSSLLKAIARLNDDAPFVANERSRRSGVDPKLAWHFQLEPADKQFLAEIPETESVERVVLTKRSDGIRVWKFEPRDPMRDRTQRDAVADWLEDLSNDVTFDRGEMPAEMTNIQEVYQSVAVGLRADEDDLPDSLLKDLNVLSRGLKFAQFARVSEPNAPESALDAFNAALDEVDNALTDLIKYESADHPYNAAVEVLRSRIPSVVIFSETERSLSSSYDLAEVADNPPRALYHLAHLAGLDLVAMRDEAMSNLIADVGTRRNAANMKLLNEFSKSWNQQGISLQVDIQGTILHIQATTPEDKGLSDIQERSDGLRWFAALLAFSYGWGNRPVMLIDEIETHLHYDAQADVIAQLSKQEFTSKVVYTTHSFGCLPSDLGAGVRVVQPIDSATSRLETGFWKSGAGFSPLMASMGAATMSLTPTRHAIIAEGPSDAILLPTLLRQATSSGSLGFQVAPGLSTVAALDVHLLEAEAGRVGFIADGDKGGKAHVAKLISAGIPQERIVVLEDFDSNTPFELEDFIEPEVYARSAMDEIRCWQETSDRFDGNELPANMRTKFVGDWCTARTLSAPDKVSVAQRVVDYSTEMTIVDPNQRNRLVDLDRRLRAILLLA